LYTPATAVGRAQGPHPPLHARINRMSRIVPITETTIEPAQPSRFVKKRNK
jgi:hypothetical protein